MSNELAEFRWSAWTGKRAIERVVRLGKSKD